VRKKNATPLKKKIAQAENSIQEAANLNAPDIPMLPVPVMQEWAKQCQVPPEEVTSEAFTSSSVPNAST
jgi:hypothetical protein